VSRAIDAAALFARHAAFVGQRVMRVDLAQVLLLASTVWAMAFNSTL